MIEMMEEYTTELEELLNIKSGHGAVKLVADGAPNMEPAANIKPPSCELASFGDRRMTMMMMMCVDSATAQPGSSSVLAY